MTDYVETTIREVERLEAIAPFLDELVALSVLTEIEEYSHENR